ncbi:Arc family DNA-binding protein [Lactobacillus bombi]|nr:Arc family DNA-binding protein [Lactobacillus sp. XV13L]MBA1435097.1 Arc family DNA-binding protein [Bombilactobacillus bombi]
MKTVMTTIRFPDELYQQIKAAAKNQHTSINQLVVQSVQQSLRGVGTASLENQLVINQIIQPAAILPKSGLIKVNGIYYRYLTENNDPILDDTAYVVIAATGNILTIRAIKK